MHRFAGSLLVLSSLALICATGAVGDDQETVNLGFHLKEGQVFDYSVKETWQFDSRKDQVTTQKLRVKVSKAGDREFTAHCSVEASGTDDDQDFVQDHVAGFVGMWFDIVYSATGVPKTVSDDSADSCSKTRHVRMMSYGFMGLAYPAAPVKVGDTWTATYDLKKGFDRLGFTTTFAPSSIQTRTYKLLSLGTENGKRVAKIEASAKTDYKIDGTKDAMKFTNVQKGDDSAVYVVDTATGLPLSVIEKTSYANEDVFDGHPISRKGGSKATIELAPVKKS